MTGLALGYMDSTSELDWFRLEGGGMLPGMLGCEWNMAAASADSVSESALLSLRGSLLELQAVTERLELLRAAEARKRGFCLRVWSETRGAYLYAPLSEMAWQVLPAHVPSAGAGSFRIKLTWLRASAFYGAEVALPLSNGSGSGVTGGLTLYNHDDPALWHDNWFDANLQAVGNLWEFPLRLELKNTTSGEALADFWLGSMALAGSGSLPNLVFEAENGSGGSILTDTNASNGQYSRYDWNGSGWRELASWTLSALDTSRLQGIGLLPLLRFLNPPAESGLRLRWELRVDGTPVWLGPASELEQGRRSLRMEPLSVPWGDLPLESAASAHGLVLKAFHSGSGAHRLDLDDFLLLPQQSFGAYHAVSALKQNASLIDDPARRAVWSKSGGLELATHLRVGSGHYLKPGTLQRFYCFQTEANGAAPIGRTVSVRAWYRPAWRLP